MSPSTSQQELECVKDTLRHAALLLNQPSAAVLNRTETLLQLVQLQLQSFMNLPRASDAASQERIAAQLAEVQRLLALVTLLLAHPAAFYQGWERLKNVLAGGYTAQGEPASVSAAGRLSVEA